MGYCIPYAGSRIDNHVFKTNTNAIENVVTSFIELSEIVDNFLLGCEIIVSNLVSNLNIITIVNRIVEFLFKGFDSLSFFFCCSFFSFFFLNCEIFLCLLMYLIPILKYFGVVICLCIKVNWLCVFPFSCGV